MPEGIHCWGCARRFVPSGQPTSGPLTSVRWREGLCNRPECNALVNAITGKKDKP